MINYKQLKQSMDENLKYLQNQQEKLQPMLDYLSETIIKQLPESNIPITEAFSMYESILDQYTNSVLVITKMQEILNYTQEVQKGK